MINKSTLIEPFSCKDTDPVGDVTEKLLKYNQRHIYVVDKSSAPVGIVSTTDILKKVVCGKMDSAKTMVKDIMTDNIHPFDDSDEVRNAYKKMMEKNVVSVPITDNGKFIGILTLDQAVKFLTDPKNL